MRHKIVGQDPAIEKVAEIYQMFLNLAVERQDATPKKQSQALRGMYVLIIDWKFAAVVTTFALVILKNFVMLVK